MSQNAPKTESPADARIDRLESVVLQLSENVAAIASSIATLATARPAASVAPAAPARGVDMAAMIAKRDEQVAKALEVDAKLQDELPQGPQKFKISLIDERTDAPLIKERIVGGGSEHEAISKWQRYNGINGVSGPSKIVCHPVSAA